MPEKITRSAPQPSFGLPEPLVGIHTSRQSCCKAAKAPIFTPVRESSGESRLEDHGDPNCKNPMLPHRLFLKSIQNWTDQIGPCGRSAPPACRRRSSRSPTFVTSSTTDAMNADLFWQTLHHQTEQHPSFTTAISTGTIARLRKKASRSGPTSASARTRTRVVWLDGSLAKNPLGYSTSGAALQAF
jgi:hypothetical protein